MGLPLIVFPLSLEESTHAWFEIGLIVETYSILLYTKNSLALRSVETEAWDCTYALKKRRNAQHSKSQTMTHETELIFDSTSKIFMAKLVSHSGPRKE
jgi:hypothetical protein